MSSQGNQHNQLKPNGENETCPTPASYPEAPFGAVARVVIRSPVEPQPHSVEERPRHHTLCGGERYHRRGHDEGSMGMTGMYFVLSGTIPDCHRRLTPKKENTERRLRFIFLDTREVNGIFRPRMPFEDEEGEGIKFLTARFSH